MPATKLYANFSGVTVTPNGGSAINITEVTSIDPDRSSNLKARFGDNRKYPRLIKAFERMRSFTITSGDLAALQSIPEDTPCTVVFILEDAQNGTGSGALTYTYTNAVMGSNPVKSPNNDFGEATVQFQCYSTDNTDPLTVAKAT